jgi:hypothetical protein
MQSTHILGQFCCSSHTHLASIINHNYSGGEGGGGVLAEKILMHLNSQTFPKFSPQTEKNHPCTCLLLRIKYNNTSRTSEGKCSQYLHSHTFVISLMRNQFGYSSEHYPHPLFTPNTEKSGRSAASNTNCTHVVSTYIHYVYLGRLYLHAS